MINKAWLLLGGNLGNKKENLQSAINHIQALTGKVIQQSPIYETAPWGFEHEESFYNQALLIETTKNSRQLLETLLDIEQSMGRVRSSSRYSERTIDIDILFFNNEVINEKNLSIPHPRIQERKFVLAPLNDIASDYIHPIHQKKVSKLLEECIDTLTVKRI